MEACQGTVEEQTPKAPAQSRQDTNYARVRFGKEFTSETRCGRNLDAAIDFGTSSCKYIHMIMRTRMRHDDNASHLYPGMLVERLARFEAACWAKTRQTTDHVPCLCVRPRETATSGYTYMYWEIAQQLVEAI